MGKMTCGTVVEVNPNVNIIKQGPNFVSDYLFIFGMGDKLGHVGSSVFGGITNILFYGMLS